MAAVVPSERYREWVKENGGLKAGQWLSIIKFLAVRVEAEAQTFESITLDVVNGELVVSDKDALIAPRPGCGRMNKPSWGHVV